MRILQLTDPHLYGQAGARLRGVETDSTLRAVLEQALAQHGDYAAMLVTGDLVQDDPAGYLHFRSILGGLRRPVLCIPGNHDEPAAMRRALDCAPFQFCGELTLGRWQFIMLNSYEAGHVRGRLADEELARLDATLAASSSHCVVCLHHHPVSMGSSWLDPIGLSNAEEFWRIVDARGCVKAVAWGHVHQSLESRRGAVALFATPSTGAQFKPRTDRYSVDDRPPGYRELRLHDDGRIESAVHWLRAGVPAGRSASAAHRVDER
jgi:Icc protein